MFPKSFILGFSSSRSFEPFIPRHLRHLLFVVQAASHFLPFSYTSQTVQVARNLASITADCHRCWRCRKTSLDSTETTLPSPSFILTLIIYARIPRETRDGGGVHRFIFILDRMEDSICQRVFGICATMMGSCLISYLRRNNDNPLFRNMKKRSAVCRAQT